MLESDPITGVMVQYYYSCKRELWFYANRVNMNYDDSNIQIGRQIQRESYDGKRKNVLIDGAISVDIVEEENTIYEVKKSSKMEYPAKMQLKYYLWYLEEKKGVSMNGILAYPEERDRERVELTDSDREEFAAIEEEIKTVVEKERPPPRKEKNFCKNCSFYDLCWV